MSSRCADPIPFTTPNTRATFRIRGGKGILGLAPNPTNYGAIISFVDGKMNPLPFDNMLDPKTGRMQNRKVNVDSEQSMSAPRLT